MYNMSEVISLKKAEKKVFSLATQDGLADVFLGCLFLGWAIAPFYSSTLGDFWSSAMLLPFWGLVMLGIWLVRRYIVKPRVGVVKFGKSRKTRLQWFIWVMLALNIIALIVGFWISLNAGTMSGRSATVIFGMISLVLFSTAGYFLDFHRLYVYGLLICLSPIVGEWIYANYGVSHHGFPITFGIASGVMLLTGLFIFIRLLQNNPLPKEDGTLEGE
jgi:hypothetical protein